MESKKAHPLWLLAGFWIGVAISLAVVARRMVALAHPSGTGRGLDLDAVFSSHAQLTLAHIVPAAVFVLLAAWVLLRRVKPEWVYTAFFGSGFLTGFTAYAMSAYAVGGWVERSAVLVFNTWFLFSLGRAFSLHRRGDVAKTRTTAPNACALEQRRWSTRAVGILLGIATTRPVMGVFFATSAITHLQPRQFFGIAFWIGFSINAIVIELWLHSRNRARLQAAAL